MKNAKQVLLGAVVLLGSGLLIYSFFGKNSAKGLAWLTSAEQTGEGKRNTQGLIGNQSIRVASEIQNTLADDYTPEEAYALAKKSVACTYSKVSAENEPAGLTSEQKEQLKASRSQGDDCSFDMKYSVYELAKYAAESGDPQAMLDFSGLAAAEFNNEKSAMNPAKIMEFKRDSVKYLLASADQGNPEALTRLSENYWNGIFSDKDVVRGYAYAYAYNSISQNEMSLVRLRQMERGVSSADLIRARQMGQEIINSRGVK